MGLVRLTHKQETFAQRVAEGATKAQAYRSTYNASGMAPTTVWPHASRLACHPRVAARIDALRAEKEAVQRMCTVSRVGFVLARLRHLAEHAASESVRVRALELLGKHCGMFKPKPELLPARTTDRIHEDVLRLLVAIRENDVGDKMMDIVNEI
jgi:hypothetical protein